MRIQRIHSSGHSFVITVPRDLLRALNWTPGTEIVLQISDGRLAIESLASHLEVMRTAKAPVRGRRRAKAGGAP